MSMQFILLAAQMKGFDFYECCGLVVIGLIALIVGDGNRSCSTNEWIT